MTPQKLLIFIVAYNAQKHIISVLDRIPSNYWDDENCEILIIDDASKDETVKKCQEYRASTKRSFTLVANPINQGYGGNQKIGYSYGIKNGFDSVVLLHGDGQYPPEMIPELIAPIHDGIAQACFGSRMINKLDALKGGMPRYKFFGNIILTRLQNKLLGTKLSEYHSGFRAYSLKALAKLPFSYNSDDFDFDTDIIIQFAHGGYKIAEIAILTRYGDEICNVNGMRYARQIMRSSLLAQLQRYQIYYQPKFDLEGENTHYPSKIHFDSSHKWAINQVGHNATLVDIGLGAGGVAAELMSTKNATVHGYDFAIDPNAARYCASTKAIHLDVEKLAFPENTKVDYVLLLDVIEHLSNPEEFLTDLREQLYPHGGCLLLSTANISFIIMRLSLLTGRFNYGKRGILDITHKRLFTFYSIKKMMKEQGYILESVEGIPVPFEFIFGPGKFSNFCLFINRLLMRISKSLFSFQVVIRARPKPTLQYLLDNAHFIAD
jgi:glycosyltransferase involved in cell wall biosynthesis